MIIKVSDNKEKFFEEKKLFSFLECAQQYVDKNFEYKPDANLANYYTQMVMYWHGNVCKKIN